MQKRLIEEGFNRRYVLLPLLLAIGLVICGFVVTEMRRADTRHLADTLRERQDLMRETAETIYKALEAESAQRGFLLSGEPKYLAPFQAAIAATQAHLIELTTRYQKLEPEEVKVLQQASDDFEAKVSEMRQSVALLQQGKPHETMALVKSDLGLYLMSAVEQTLEALRTRERVRIFTGLTAWSNATRLNTLINLCGSLFTIGVLIILGLLATRDIRRRSGYTADLAMQVAARTAELQDLSRHMSRVAEAEKHSLARELHDELGGVLVAMRMDIAQIRRRLGPTDDADLQARWQRVEQALATGVALKQRVIEELRPTLLDNMGLYSALRWLAEQSSEQSGLKLYLRGLDEDIDLPPELAIAVFRTAQEAIANVVRHAQATTLVLQAQIGESLWLRIADDGRGFPPDLGSRVGSHGLKQMRFRMEAVGGRLQIEPNEPTGTVVLLSVSISSAATV